MRTLLLLSALLVLCTLNQGTCAPIHNAAKEGNLQKVKDLIKQGVSVNAPDESKRPLPPFLRDSPLRPTPLHLAASNGHLEIVNYLLKMGAKIAGKNRTHQTPLHLATLNGHFKIVKTLIEAGCPVNVKDHKNQTPLMYAVTKNSQLDIVLYLIKKGANVNVTSSNPGNSALHDAAWIGEKDLVEILIKAGASVDIQDLEGKTPLHYASSFDYKDIAELLIKAGANIEAKTHYGNHTPVWYAYSGIKTLSYLMHLGANIHVISKNDKRTLLHNAAYQGSIDVVELLVKEGADIYLKDKRGQTPLDMAERSLAIHSPNFPPAYSRKGLEKVIEYLKNAMKEKGVK